MSKRILKTTLIFLVFILIGLFVRSFVFDDRLIAVEAIEEEQI